MKIGDNIGHKIWNASLGITESPLVGHVDN